MPYGACVTSRASLRTVCAGMGVLSQQCAAHGTETRALASASRAASARLRSSSTRLAACPSRGVSEPHGHQADDCPTDLLLLCARAVLLLGLCVSLRRQHERRARKSRKTGEGVRLCVCLLLRLGTLAAEQLLLPRRALREPGA
jgi:hypothetical protein